MSEFRLPLTLNTAEIRVLKAALLVEIASLEQCVRVDSQPEIWLPSLNAARRVLTALSDKANKQQQC